MPRANFAVKIKMRGAREDQMKKAVFVAVVLAAVAMSIEPVGWLVAGKPGGWVHKEAAFVIGVAPFAIGSVYWLIMRWSGKPGF